MEYSIIPENEVQQEPPFETTDQPVHPERAFILANTVASSKEEVISRHVIPVFVKDNERVISHGDFIEVMQEATADVFSGERILMPSVRLSHPIKGRAPEAKDKSAKELLEHEKTLYYERMAFTIEISSVFEDISGNKLNLMVGGVKAYNLDNLYQKSGADQTFKIFIGFQNKVCTNLCVWSDGYVGDLKVKDAKQLRDGILKMFYQYDLERQLSFMKSLDQYALTETQFAQLIGRCRLYHYLSNEQKREIPALQLSDTQLNAVARDYYRDNSFCRETDGTINLWRLYNLFTGAAKSSYVDSFLDRMVSASSFTRDIRDALSGKSHSWFLN
jgi:hypothetical protein